MSIIDRLLQLIAPHHCLGCGEEGFLLCKACAQGLPAVPPRCYRCGAASEASRTCTRCAAESPLAAVTAATTYGDLAKHVVHQLKFERGQAAANEMAALIASRLDWEGTDCITHVPTASVRARTRGYDQAALIACALARYTGLPYRRLLGRRGSQRQVGQGRTARQQQMQDVFYVRRSASLKELSVLVVDDVFTTGATCEAAARALLEGGARRVSAAVFAAAK